MSQHSYKHYLDDLTHHRKFSRWQKISLLSVIMFFLLLGSLSALIYYQNQKITPNLAQKAYLDKIAGDFNRLNQSIDETLANQKILGARTDFVSDLAEATDQAWGFYIVLDDQDKLIATIDSVKSNLLIQKESLLIQEPPGNLGSLHANLIAYYDTTVAALTDIINNQRFARQMLISSGPQFYLPALTQQALWDSATKEAITSYYQETKAQAIETQNKLLSFNPPPAYFDYYHDQINYFNELVKVADNIINILVGEDDPDPDAATQIEKAYQILVGATRQNEALSQKLKEAHQRLVSLSETHNKLAATKLNQISLESQIADYYNQLQFSAIYP